MMDLGINFRLFREYKYFNQVQNSNTNVNALVCDNNYSNTNTFQYRYCTVFATNTLTQVYISLTFVVPFWIYRLNFPLYCTEFLIYTIRVIIGLLYLILYFLCHWQIISYIFILRIENHEALIEWKGINYNHNLIYHQLEEINKRIHKRSNAPTNYSIVFSYCTLILKHFETWTRNTWWYWLSSGMV